MSVNTNKGLESLPTEILLMILEQISPCDNINILQTNKTLASVVRTNADYIGRQLAERSRQRLYQAVANIDFASNDPGLVPALRRYLCSVDIPHVGNYPSVPIWAGEFAALYAPICGLPIGYTAALVHALFNAHGMRALQKHLCRDPFIHHQSPGYVNVYPIAFLGHFNKLDDWERLVRARVTRTGGITPSQYDELLQQVLESNPFAGKPGSVSVPASTSEWFSEHGELHRFLTEDGRNFDLPRLPTRLRWYSKSGSNGQFKRFAGDRGRRLALRSRYSRSLFVAAALEDLGICSTISDRLDGAKVHVRTNR